MARVPVRHSACRSERVRVVPVREEPAPARRAVVGRAFAALIADMSAAGVCEPLVLFNGNVYTVDERNPRAQAIVAGDGRITYVGTGAEALKRAPAGARHTVEEDMLFKYTITGHYRYLPAAMTQACADH